MPPRYLLAFLLAGLAHGQTTTPFPDYKVCAPARFDGDCYAPVCGPLGKEIKKGNTICWPDPDELAAWDAKNLTIAAPKAKVDAIPAQKPSIYVDKQTGHYLLVLADGNELDLEKMIEYIQKVETPCGNLPKK